MSSQIFLYIEVRGRGITGEASTAGGYEGEIEVESFSFDLGEQSEASQEKSDEAYRQLVYEAQKEGKPVPSRPSKSAGNTLSVTKFYDRASTNLARYLGNGASFDEARLTVDHHTISGEEKLPNPAMSIHLFKGRIRSLGLNLSDGDKSAKLMETIKLSYRRIEIVYYKSSRKDRTARSTNFVFSDDLDMRR